MEFPWRCNVDTIAMDLKVSWEMSVKTLTEDIAGERQHEKSVGTATIGGRGAHVL